MTKDRVILVLPSPDTLFELKPLVAAGRRIETVMPALAAERLYAGEMGLRPPSLTILDRTYKILFW